MFMRVGKYTMGNGEEEIRTDMENIWKKMAV